MKADIIEVGGEVIAIHRGGDMTVRLGNGHDVLARVNGRMRQNHIRCILGDQVLCEMSTYDFSRARVTFRFK